jgi:hypothetical protein
LAQSIIFSPFRYYDINKTQAEEFLENEGMGTSIQVKIDVSIWEVRIETNSKINLINEFSSYKYCLGTLLNVRQQVSIHNIIVAV